MKKILITFTLIHFMFFEAFSFRMVEKNIQMARQQSEAINNCLKRFSIDQLKILILVVEIYKFKIQQEEEKLIKEIEEKKLMHALSRQRIIQTYLGANVGAKSVLMDFFSNRI